MGEYVFKLPDVGEGTAEAEIVAWHIKVGDEVEEDQPVVDVMTDKATVEMTAPVSGRVLSINGGEPGDMCPVGATLAVLEIEGDGHHHHTPASKPASAPPATATPAPQSKAEPAVARPVEPAPAPMRVAGAGPLASPAVRRRAQELGIDLASVPGSGPAGRISHADLDAFVAKPAVADRYQRRDGAEEVKIIGLRRRIAEHLQESSRRIPHFAYVEEVDVTTLEELRVYLNAHEAGDRPRLTPLPFLIRAVVRALPDFPNVNATLDDEAMVLHRQAAAHVGVATQTPNGLVVPVVRHAEARDLWDLAAEVGRLSAAAREGTATREELSGSTITVTSLGNLGGIAATPVINHPEVAIVGPNRIVERPVVRDGQIIVRKMMNISSSFDHRIVDGHDAARFIQRIKTLLEQPALLFMD